MRAPSSIRTRGFTLIELLTVIAIIGFLAAILIPVVGRVRMQARGSVCQTNLRNIGMAMFLYAEDNDGRLPPFNDPQRPAQGLWWLQGLMGQNEVGNQQWPNYLDDHWYRSEERAHKLICPQSASVYSGIQGVGYGLNLLTQSHAYAPSLERIREPTRVVLVADAVVHESINWYDSALGPWTGGYPNTTHGGGAFYLFAAGNVRFVEAQNPNEAHSPPVGMNRDIFFRKEGM